MFGSLIRWTLRECLQRRAYETAKAMPPLWQYFSRSKKSRRLHLRTPGRAAPQTVTPANQPLLGSAMGAMIVMMAPPPQLRLPRFGLEGRLTGGRRLGPVVAVLGRVCEIVEAKVGVPCVSPTTSCLSICDPLVR